MKIIFLGTNGWYTTAAGNTPCILIDASDHYVVFDAGNGIYKLDRYIKEEKPISLFISHFHLDHVSGLHTLAKFKFTQGIDIYVGAGRKKDFDALVNPPFTMPADELSIPIRLHELSDGKQQIPFPADRDYEKPVVVEVIEQFHAYKDHGFRVTLEGKTIAYSGDCGISKASLTLAKNADLLIHECSYKAGHAPDTWGHVGPLEAAKLSKEAGVKKLILTHFDASLYLTLEDRKESEKQARTIFPNTLAAADDIVITL